MSILISAIYIPYNLCFLLILIKIKTEQNRKQLSYIAF